MYQRALTVSGGGGTFKVENTPIQSASQTVPIPSRNLMYVLTYSSSVVGMGKVENGVHTTIMGSGYVTVTDTGSGTDIKCVNSGSCDLNVAYME